MKLSQGLAALALLILTVSNTAAQTKPPKCPVITISCPRDGFWLGNPIKFFARIDGPIPRGKRNLSWTLSGGKIVGGQGTSTITVNTDDLEFGPITATLQMLGIKDCETISTCTAEPFICGLPSKFDEYGALTLEDENARLDNFAIQVTNQQGVQAYVIAYAGSGQTPEDIETRLRRTKNYLVKNRGLKAGRIVTKNGGRREELTVQLYIIPIGFTPPEPTPSVPEEGENVKPPAEHSNP